MRHHYLDAVVRFEIVALDCLSSLYFFVFYLFFLHSFLHLKRYNTTRITKSTTCCTSLTFLPLWLCFLLSAPAQAVFCQSHASFWLQSGLIMIRCPVFVCACVWRDVCVCELQLAVFWWLWRVPSQSLHPRGPMWSRPCHFLFRSSTPEWCCTCHLFLTVSSSFSFSLSLSTFLQVLACLQPKGYRLFLLKECWL